MIPPAHTEIPAFTFLDEKEGIYATTEGEAVIFLRLEPQDSECMDQEDMTAISMRFESALRLVEPGYRLYQYLIKRRIDSPGKIHFSYSTWVAILAPHLDVPVLRRMASGFSVQLGDMVSARVASKEEVWNFHCGLVNYDPDLVSAIKLKHDQLIGYWGSHSEVKLVKDGVIKVGDHFARVLTLKEPPYPKTGPDLLRPLREIPYECIICTEWKPLNQDSVRTLIKSKTSHFHLTRNVTSFAAVIAAMLSKVGFGSPASKERPEDMQKDTGAMAMEEQLGALLRDVEVSGTVVGEFAMTVIVMSRDEAEVERATQAAFKAMTEREAIMLPEYWNVQGAWFAALPGAHRRQLRYMYLTDHNYADFSMLFAPAAGQKRNEHLQAECLAVLETRQMSPYYLNLHYGDVFHTGFIGQTGAGKSFTASWCLSQAIERYGARITIFDIGGSYRSLVRKHFGSYASLGLNNAFTMAPFSLDLTPEHLVFLHAFVKMLMQSSGYTRERATDDGVIEGAIKHLYSRNPVERRLGLLELPEYLSPYLDKWRSGGRYGSLFDNTHDTLTTNDLQAFDFEGLDDFGEVLEPFLFYVFHRVSCGIDEDPRRLKILMVDECWKFLINESAKRYIRGAFKTFRKKNTGIWIATQSLEDLVRSGMDETVTENCASLIFLPNPGMNAPKYKAAFHMKEAESVAVLNMQPKCEWLLKQPSGSKILRLVI